MKNEENEIRTDRNEIQKICARFYTDLFSSTLQHHPLKDASPDSSEVPRIMTLEVKKTLKEMKNDKATGIHDLTSDVMILGGEESVQ